jgi:hypothetical protein
MIVSARAILRILLGTALGFGAASAWPLDSAPPVPLAPLPTRGVVAPVMPCESLAHRDFTGIPDAPTVIASAQIEPAAADRPEFCVVRGYVAPQIHFELHLPTRTYTGRYLQGGCGGVCGKIYRELTPECDTRRALGGDFAVGFNDSGHVGASNMDAVWAYGAPALRVDYAYRAPHVSAVAAKALIAAYYGTAPAVSYFQGCSDGGREGLSEAQRYPRDFAGIVAGAPAIWITPGVIRFLYETRVAIGPDHQPILTPQAAALLHAAVMSACDALDGLKDGQIDDPRACRYDPQALACRAGASPPQCLTPAQVEVVRELYRGPTDAAGRFLYLGGEPYGSELTWTDPRSLINAGTPLIRNQIEFMIFGGHPPAGFGWDGLKLDDATLAMLLKYGAYYDTSNPDLSAFRRAGGKLILWQGAADSPGGAYSMLDYYQRVRDAAGGLESARSFARAFLVPGMYHCRGGYIAYQQDVLGPLVSWVEAHQAPDSVLASAILADGTLRRRPVYAYPVRAHYRGGDINKPSSFVPRSPEREPDDHFDWLGAKLSVQAAH